MCLYPSVIAVGGQGMILSSTVHLLNEWIFAHTLSDFILAQSICFILVLKSHFNGCELLLSVGLIGSSWHFV